MTDRSVSGPAERERHRDLCIGATCWSMSFIERISMLPFVLYRVLLGGAILALVLM